MAEGNIPDTTSFGSDKIRHDPTSNKCVDAHAIDLIPGPTPEESRKAIPQQLAPDVGLNKHGAVRKDPFLWTATPRSPSRQRTRIVSRSPSLDTSRVQAWERAVGDRNTEPRGRKDRRASGEDEPDSPLQDMLQTVIRATVEGLQEAGAGLVGRPPEPVGEPPPGGIPVPPVKARGWLKLDHYDGSTPWETYRIQLDECCTYNGWNDAEKLAQLTIALRDPARRVLLHRGSGSSFASLCHELQTHFGTEG